MKSIQLSFDSPKLCECGCGQPTPLAKRTHNRIGLTKGVPLRLCIGHRIPSDIGVRFWSKVDKSGGPDACWLWTGAHLPRGYGMLDKGGRTIGYVYAHRFSYALHNGPIPEGMLVCHTCDNPACVNPIHLFVGSEKDNVADMIAKGRGSKKHAPPRYGVENPSAKLTDADVIEMRRLWAAGVNQPTLARQFGITQSSVSTIVHRHSWKHLP